MWILDKTCEVQNLEREIKLESHVLPNVAKREIEKSRKERKERTVEIVKRANLGTDVHKSAEIPELTQVFEDLISSLLR